MLAVTGGVEYPQIRPKPQGLRGELRPEQATWHYDIGEQQVDAHRRVRI
jgi:hypothetical protein